MNTLDNLGEFRKRHEDESIADYFKNAVTKAAKLLSLSQHGNEPQTIISSVLQRWKKKEFEAISFLKAAYDAILDLMSMEKKIPDPKHVFDAVSDYLEPA